MKRDLLSVTDFSREEILEIFKEAEYLRRLREKGKRKPLLEGKILGLIFEKPSTRTRVSFEVGMWELGGYALYLSFQELQLGRGESIEDTAKVLSRYLNGVLIRTFKQENLEKFAKSSSIPVINGLSDLLHPCQALSDYYTLWRRGMDLSRLKLTWVGDGNNVCHSLILAGAILGAEVRVSTPRVYQPRKEILEKAEKIAPGKVKLFTNPEEAVKGARVIYTDVWVSMGKEKEREERRKVFLPYRLNEELLKKAPEDVLVMHCLPAHRGEEITSRVMDGERSIVFEQAENRLHLQKSLLVKLLR